MEENEFFTVAPRDNKYLKYTVGPMPLMVVRDNGIDADYNLDVKTTYVGKGHWIFKNNAKNTISFKINVLIPLDDSVVGAWTEWFGPSLSQRGPNGAVVVIDHIDYKTELRVTDVLHYCIRNAVPLYVVTESEVVRNGLYIVTSNPRRQQSYDNYAIWELEFFEYKEYDVPMFTETSKGAKNALKKYKKKNTKNKDNAKKKANSSTSNKSKLKNCDYKKIKYSKSKKVTKCAKYLQTELYKAKFLTKSQIDGWFGNVTKNALKSYQNKYKKKYKLKATGSLDLKTFQVLTGTSKNGRK